MLPCPMVICFCSSWIRVSITACYETLSVKGQRNITIRFIRVPQHGKDKKKIHNKSMSHPTTKAMLRLISERFSM